VIVTVPETGIFPLMSVPETPSAPESVPVTVAVAGGDAVPVGYVTATVPETGILPVTPVP
jgi:hypothetical protein